MFYKLYFIVLILCWQLVTNAQKSPFTLEGSIQTGLVEGSEGNAFQLAATTGVRYRTWSVGVGGGLDYYHTRSIPVFFELRKAFGAKEKGFFLYANGGHNFAWAEKPKEVYNGYPVTEAKGGLYVEGGIGYQVAAFKKTKLFFSAGYAEKHIAVIQKQMAYPILIDVLLPPPIDHYYPVYTNQYTLRSLSFKMGLRF